MGEGDLSQRWKFWMLALLPFLYIVYELLVGLAAATASETDPRVRDLVFRAQWVAVVSWLTYPVVYIFPMLGFKGAKQKGLLQRRFILDTQKGRHRSYPRN